MIAVSTSYGLLWPEICLTILGACCAVLAIYQCVRRRSFMLLTLGVLSTAFAIATGLRICNENCSVTQLAISSILSDTIISLLFIALIQQLGVWCSTASLKWPPHVALICRVLSSMQCIHALLWMAGQAYILSLVPSGASLHIVSRQLLSIGKIFIGFYLLGVWLTLLGLLGFTVLLAVLLRQCRAFTRRYSNTRPKLVVLLMSAVYMVLVVVVYASLVTTAFQKTLRTSTGERVEQSMRALMGPSHPDLSAWLMMVVRAGTLLTLMSLTCMHGYMTHLLTATRNSSGSFDARNGRSLLRFPVGKEDTKVYYTSPTTTAADMTTSDYTDLSLCYDSKADWGVHSDRDAASRMSGGYAFPMPPPRALSPILDIGEESEDSVDPHRYNPLYGYRQPVSHAAHPMRQQQVQATTIRPAMAHAMRYDRHGKEAIESLDSLLINIPIALPKTYSFSAAVSAAADAVASGTSALPRGDKDAPAASPPESPIITPPSPLPASYQSVTLKEALKQARSRETILRAARKHNA